MPYRVLQILFAVKLVVILPFVNLPSFFRITQQISDASNPLDAEPLSGAWIFSLAAYIFLNCCGFFRRRPPEGAPVAALEFLYAQCRF